MLMGRIAAAERSGGYVNWLVVARSGVGELGIRLGMSDERSGSCLSSFQWLSARAARLSLKENVREEKKALLRKKSSPIAGLCLRDTTLVSAECSEMIPSGRCSLAAVSHTTWQVDSI